MTNTVESFILDYFDQNPLSQLGIILSKNSIAEKITELSGADQRRWTHERTHTIPLEWESVWATRSHLPILLPLGNPSKHLKELRERAKIAEGEVSLQNSLLSARDSLWSVYL